MTIQYKPLSDTDYSARSFDVILLVEGRRLFPYRDTQGYPTIGIGFKIDSNTDDILEGMGFNVRPSPGTVKGTPLKY